MNKAVERIRNAGRRLVVEEPFIALNPSDMFSAAVLGNDLSSFSLTWSCFMHCHGRIMKNIVGRENMVQFDALPIYNKGNKYSDIMLVDEIPEAERKDLARQVAKKILANLRNGTQDSESQPSEGCSELLQAAN